MIIINDTLECITKLNKKQLGMSLYASISVLIGILDIYNLF